MTSPSGNPPAKSLIPAEIPLVQSRSDTMGTDIGSPAVLATTQLPSVLPRVDESTTDSPIVVPLEGAFRSEDAAEVGPTPTSTPPSAAHSSAAAGSTGRFDPVIHPPNRLRICAVLGQSEEFEFSAVRDLVGVSDSVMSKQLAVLMDAGYVVRRRAVRGSRQRVWISLTSAGRTAFRDHVQALRAIVGH